jgi:hypothetical protein
MSLPALPTSPAGPLAPRFTAPTRLVMAIESAGHAVISPEGLCEMIGVGAQDLAALQPSWDGLPPDTYLRDGGRYRRRRHACFTVVGTEATHVPRRAHWQPVEYNALHGGLERWFEPVLAEVIEHPAWPRLLAGLSGVCSRLKGEQTWYVEAHQFRIDTTDGIGRPTPEGAHRDGVDFVAVLLVGRVGIKGGETRVFEADGPNGMRFTLTEPWTLLMLDDARVIHESTPIQPLTEAGHRDTLVLTFRRGAFQGP